MTEQEEKSYKTDMENRKIIMINSIMIAIGKNDDIKNIIKTAESVKQLYMKSYDKYIGKYIDICGKAYSYGDYWFNDAGFQYKWKNHKKQIQLECITWNQVRKLLIDL